MFQLFNDKFIIKANVLRGVFRYWSGAFISSQMH